MKKKITIITIVVFVVGLIIAGSSYAFWSWTSNVNKNVVFNIASNLRNYIVYNEGESAFTGELQVSNSYQTGSVHATVSIYKTTNVNMLATLHMDVNQIGPNMKNSTALKWVVTEGTATNVGSELAHGNFVGANNGDLLTLVPDINITTTEAFYTVWIWIDSSENPSDNISGETLDTDIWMEINQVEGSEDRYEITNTNAHYQQVSATVVDNKYKVTRYAITTTNSDPSTWTTITPTTEQNNVYTLNESVSDTGTYYIWFMDSEGRVTCEQVVVTEVDTTKPSCSWGAFTPNTVQNNATSSVTLTCIDSESGIGVYNLQASDFTPSNNKITVTNVTRESVTNGYKYTITVTGTTNDGTSHLTVDANEIRNGAGLGNLSTSSGDISVINIINITLDNASAMTNGTSTIYLSYNDGIYLDSGLTNQMTDSTNPITIPQRNGYSFLGYYDGAIQMIDSTGHITSNFTNTSYSSAKTLNAHWISHVQVITFDASTNGGSLVGTSPLYTYNGTNLLYTDSNANTAAQAPTANKTGYSFTGWYNTANAKDMRKTISYNSSLQLFRIDLTNDNDWLLTSADLGTHISGILVITSPSTSEPVIRFNDVEITWTQISKVTGTYTIRRIFINFDITSEMLATTPNNYEIVRYLDVTNVPSNGNVQVEYLTKGGNKVLDVVGAFTEVPLTGYTDTNNWTVSESKTLYANFYDDVAPTGTVSLAANDLSIAATVSASDPSGISDYKYYIQTTSECPENGPGGVSYISSNNPNYTFNITTGGTYYVCVILTDTLGNSSDPISESVTFVNVAYSSGNLTYGLSDVGNTNSYHITYSVNDEVITATANRQNNSSWGYINAKVYLQTGKTYYFNVDTNGTYSYNGDAVYMGLSLDGLTGENETLIWFPSNNDYEFTVETAGEYWFRIVINEYNSTYTFSNLSIEEKIIEVKVPGEALGTLPTMTKPYYTSNGWFTLPDGGTQVTESSLAPDSDTTYYAYWIKTQYDYTGNYQTFIARESGYYKIETWGAQGGAAKYNTQYYGGNGGYSSGYINLSKGDTLYIYVGGQGNSVTGTTGSATVTANGNSYNGGGPASFYKSNSNGGGGGGATDIRLVSGAWNNETSLNSRIMVAGGGGGARSHSSTPKYSGTGGVGGTLIGGTGSTGNTYCYAVGTGGGQGTPGSSTTCTDDGHAYANNALFGYGWYDYTNTLAMQSGNTTSMGGGGGYYGGGIGYHAPSGGGSSFISGYAGVNAITASDDRTHTNNTKHYSNKYFIDSTMTSGVNSGNGKAVITYVGDAPARINTDLNDVRYIKDCVNGNTVNSYNQWREIQAIVDGQNVAKNATISGTVAAETGYEYSYAVDGLIDNSNYSRTPLNTNSLQCVIVDLGQAYNLDELAIWHAWDNGRTYNDNVTYVSSNGQLWKKAIDRTEAETVNGKRVTAWDTPIVDNETTAPFYYTGNYQTFTAPQSGYYKIETWGAQGGGAGGASGGYSSGYINLTSGDTIYVYAGQKGSTTTNIKTFNGGTGNSGGYNGGGATDIRYFGNTTPTSSDLEWDSVLGINSRIMVAAGGGSASSGTGGAGGTLIGVNGGGTAAGTQTTFGAVQNSSYTVSEFGIANGGCTGGNGYYPGGGATCANGAGGGSSFISGYAGVNAITASDDRTHTNNTRHYSNKYFIDSTMTSGVNSDNGKVVIKLVSNTPAKVNTNIEGVRYIKDCVNGNTVNAYNQWREIQAIVNGQNVAKNATISGTVAAETGYEYSYAVDGLIDDSNYSRTPLNTNSLQCVIVDLGQAYNLDELAIWHAWDNGRTYHDNVTYVSSDNSNWTIAIYKNEAETVNGKRVNAWSEPLNYRYIAYDANGGSAAPVPTLYEYDASGTTSINLTSSIPVRTGYELVGWADSPSATTAQYAAGASWPRSNASTTLYAVWERVASQPIITVIDHDTFSYSSTGAEAYYVSSTITKPSAGAAQSTFALNTWTTATSTGDLTLAGGAWYVWAETEASASGKVSATSGSIAVRSVTRSQGTGTTLTTRYDSSSGTAFTASPVYVLNGSVVYVTASLSSTYANLSLKNGSTTISAGNQTINANASFASSAAYRCYSPTSGSKCYSSASTSSSTQLQGLRPDNLLKGSSYNSSWIKVVARTSAGGNSFSSVSCYIQISNVSTHACSQ